ncbi:hypothetical protein MLD52_21985 [Puniceicoccaceae bacterium K14]|nr:hypothetical protein [Puniceicoccaceae bacterium K14]
MKGSTFKYINGGGSYLNIEDSKPETGASVFGIPFRGFVSEGRLIPLQN